MNEVISDVGFDQYLVKMQEYYSQHNHVFTTDVQGLWEAYLDNLPAERQYHNCHACRDFITTYGGLVSINEEGITSSAVWNLLETPEFYRPSINAMCQLIHKSKVTGVFYSSLSALGKPVTGVWKHFAVEPVLPYSSRVKTAKQAMAEKKEDYKNVKRALSEYKKEVVDKTLTLLRSGALPQAHAVLGQVAWLQLCYGMNRNQLWRAVAMAPAGFCHPRSGVAGTLFDDIAAGKDVTVAFAAKMHPLRYQRSQAAPSEGNIKQAEELVEKMGIGAALKRRFALLDEIPTIWKPAPIKTRNGGVFGHLLPKNNIPTPVTPTVTITWEKFARTVLPEAKKIEYYVPHTRTEFCAITAAVDSEAPLIFQWSHPFNWYLWHNGSDATQWGLKPGSIVEVKAITLKPSMWNEPMEHHGVGAIFMLEGMKETKFHSNALFPSTLKSELHPVRSTIEAYSKNAKLEAVEGDNACGIMVGLTPQTFRVNGELSYRIDRWD